MSESKESELEKPSAMPSSPLPPASEDEDPEWAYSMEIDEILNTNLTWFLGLKDKSLRDAHDAFNRDNQSLSSLYVLAAFMLIFSIPFAILLGMSFGDCETVYDYCSWVFTVLALIIINALVWKIYVSHYKVVAQHKGNLPKQSRQALQKFIFHIFVAIDILLCYRLIHKTIIIGQCDHDSVVNWNCNPHADTHGLPNGMTILIMLVPIIYTTSIRGTPFEFTMALWLIGMIAMVGCLVAADLHGSTMFVVYYAVASFVILLEARRLNYSLFFTHRKLQKILKEHAKAADAATAVEMRHMIANVAHDLKTPLSSFLSGIEVISQVVTDLHVKRMGNINIHMEDLEDCIYSITSCITNIRNTNSFMLMTINRCIDYTKASKGLKLVPKYETIDLMETLSLPLNCMKDIQHRVSITLQPIPKEICSHIITDKQWLQENVLCLLSNAVKYSSEGTVTVTISLGSEVGEFVNSCGEQEQNGVIIKSSGSAEWKLNVSRQRSFTAEDSKSLPQDRIRVEVEDHGIGLSDEAMSTLFNPFKQAQRLAGGTGLGLFSLAKRIEALDGVCGVQRRRDGAEGSLFWFEIPYRPDHSAATMWSRPIAMKAVSGKHRFTPRINTLRLPTAADHFSASSQSSMPSTSVTTVVSFMADHGCRTPCANVDEIRPRVDSSCESSKSLTPQGSVVNMGTQEDDAADLEILVVDDSPAILKMTTMMLKRHKHKVSTATNGAEALKVVAERMETVGRGFDVVLMDLQMPVMDGLEATRRLRNMEKIGSWPPMRRRRSSGSFSAPKSPQSETTEGCAVNLHSDFECKTSPDNKPTHSGSFKATVTHHVIIGVSANSDSDTAAEAYRAGMDAFITKPFALDMFYRTYDEVIDREERF